MFRTKEEWEKIKNEPEDYFGAKISDSDSNSDHSTTDEPKPKIVSKPTASKLVKINQSKTKKRERKDSSDSSMSDEPMKAPESPGKWEIVPGSSQTRSVLRLGHLLV